MDHVSRHPKEAVKYLRNLISSSDRGEFIEPSKRTLGSWLDDWHEKTVKAQRSPATYRVYETAIRLYIKPGLGQRPLQGLTPSDIEHFHATMQRERRLGESGLAPNTGRLNHAILSAALKVAVRDGLCHRNVAALATNRPAATPIRQSGSWTATEALTVLEEAKTLGPQAAALFAVALDSGARRAELAGLRWADVDLTTSSLRIERQLLKSRKVPIFGPTKTKKTRVLDLSAETLAILKEHKRTQAEEKLATRLDYVEHGLIFAQPLGSPLRLRVVEGMLVRLIAKAEVRRITLHGLRHTSATLLLQAGVQPHVVQRRLGHSSISTTLNLYAHVLPAMQQDAAARLAALLYR